MNGDKEKTLNDFLESDSLKTFGEKSADGDALMEAFRQREVKTTNNTKRK